MHDNDLINLEKVFTLKERYKSGSYKKVKRAYRMKSLVKISNYLKVKALQTKDPELLDLAIYYKDLVGKYENWLESISSVSMPKGIVFVIASSNIELLSLYNWGISFLCGNLTIIRISRRLKREKIDGVVEIIRDVLKTKFCDIFFQDEEDNRITRNLTQICDVRILWGSDKTIEEIRKEYSCNMQEDIAFSSKKSMTLIKASKLINLKDTEKNKLIKNLWNDTLELSFKACSSPHKICIIGKDADQKRGAQEILDLLKKRIKKESMTNGFITTNNLLESQLRSISGQANRQSFSLRGRLIKITSEVSEIKNDTTIEVIVVNSLDKVNGVIRATRPQTLTYFGIDKDELQKLINKEESCIPDRIEKVGYALSFDVIWDGINLFERLSKQVNYDI